jgi:putative ABC transport system permease protein
MPFWGGGLLWALSLLLPKSVHDGLAGDLEELYSRRVCESGRIGANAWLLGQVMWACIRYGPSALGARLSSMGWTVTGGGGMRSGVRQITRAPGFATLVILLVALGVGATVTVYSLVDGVLMTPMPYPEPERVVSVSEDNPNIRISAGWTSIPNFLDWRDQAGSFSSMALFRGRSASVGTQGYPEYAYSAFVTPEFFDVFGVAPEFGRGFTADEARDNGDRVVVLSYGLWQNGYGMDPDILGRTISVDGSPRTVVGVMPKGFNSPGEWMGAGITMSLWQPFALDSDTERGNRSYSAVARLGDGVTLEAARAEIEGLHAQLRLAYPDANGEWRSQILVWQDLILGATRAPLYLLLGTMLFVLAIVCANVASLTTTRVLSRGREMATRTALGAPRGKIISQVLAEVIVLVGAGGILGAIFSTFGLAGFKAVEPGLLRRLASVQIDASVLLFGLGLTLFAALSVGAIAALIATRGDTFSLLRGTGVGHSVFGWRVRGSLTVVQFVMSFALLAGATLLATSFSNLHRADLGFDPENVTAMTVAVSWDRVSVAENRTAFTRELLAELERVPGVESVAMINSLPLSGSRSFARIDIEGMTEEGNGPALAVRSVSDRYHETMKIGVTQGRTFTPTDMETASTALVNETAAQLHWPNVSPLGARVRSSGGEWLTVVGVSRDVLHDGARREVLPELYVPYQIDGLTSKSFVVRTTAGASVASAMRDALAKVDPEQPVRQIRTMEDWVAHGIAVTRFQAALMGAAAGFATILAGIGLFAALANVVRERRREIAIRVALGAEREGVIRLVVRKASLLVLPGLCGGLLLALALGAALEGFLFGVQGQNVAALSFVTLGLLATAFLAAYLPTARAVALDPAQVLREE